MIVPEEGQIIDFNLYISKSISNIYTCMKSRLKIIIGILEGKVVNLNQKIFYLILYAIFLHP